MLSPWGHTGKEALYWRVERDIYTASWGIADMCLKRG